MPRLTYYVQGDWNAQCAECGRGFKFLTSLRKRWDNAWVCSACWEPRQPQDFIRSVRDDSSVPIGLPRILPTFNAVVWTNVGPVTWTNGPYSVTWTD